MTGFAGDAICDLVDTVKAAAGLPHSTCVKLKTRGHIFSIHWANFADRVGAEDKCFTTEDTESTEK